MYILFLKRAIPAVNVEHCRPETSAFLSLGHPRFLTKIPRWGARGQEFSTPILPVVVMKHTHTHTPQGNDQPLPSPLCLRKVNKGCHKLTMHVTNIV